MDGSTSTEELPKYSQRSLVLGALVALQALCAVFFVGDVTRDIALEGIHLHNIFEGFVSAALVLGVVFGAMEMRRSQAETNRANAALSAASGAFARLIEAYFERWKLTPAEADVALFVIKGMDVADIASLRGSASGTVRAQLANIYAKAEVSSRSQVVCLFIDDLLAGPIVGAEVRS